MNLEGGKGWRVVVREAREGLDGIGSGKGWKGRRDCRRLAKGELLHT